MSSHPRSAPWPAVVVLVLLVELLVWNLYVAYRNQQESDPITRVRPRSRNIARVAEENPFPVVKGVFAFYYRMRILRGATVVAPSKMAGHQFNLERFSRIKLEIDPALGEIDPAAVDRIIHGHQDTRYLQLDSETPVRVLFERGTRRYVMQRLSDGYGFVIMSEAKYRAEHPAP